MKLIFKENAINREIAVNTDPGYKVFLSSEWLSPVKSRVGNYSSYFLVTDTNLLDTQDEAINAITQMSGFKGQYVLTAGENSKSFAELENLLSSMLESGLDRQALVIVFGGGVVSDIAALAASLFKRGINVMILPTSLLAMVDAAIGGKTAVNHPLGKNLVGTFWQPESVLINPGFLSTLPEREFKSGLAEILKYGYIFDREFLTWIGNNLDNILKRETTYLEQIISFCVSCKARVAAADERESQLRMVLNFGHTFGHALERFFNYSKMQHGEAVNLGMLLAIAYAEEAGDIHKGLFEKMFSLHRKLGINIELISRWNANIISGHMMGDKKVKAESIKLILPYHQTVRIVEIAKGESFSDFLDKMKSILILEEKSYIDV